MERKNRANETRAKEAENQTKPETERERNETDKTEVKWRLWIIYHQDTKTHEKWR
jgi:hypothetical protein